MNRFTSPKSIAVMLASSGCYLVFHLIKENTGLKFDMTDVSAAQGLVTCIITLISPHATQPANEAQS
jgi:hypothetical protein